MNATAEAPDIKPGYPSKGQKLGPAWRALWAELQRAQTTDDTYLDGRVLADIVAPDYGLEPSTLVALLSRMAKAGILVREARRVKVQVDRGGGRVDNGSRTRSHYSISPAVSRD